MMRNSTLKPGKGFKPRTKQMSRGSGFSRASSKTPAAGAGVLRVDAVRRTREPKAPKPRKQLKSGRPQTTAIRASARNQECTLRFEGICNRNPETTVWCHSNRLADGKGLGLKAPDEQGCYGCSDCHAWLDGGYAGHVAREVVDARFDVARAESQEKLRAQGLLPNSETATVAAGPTSEQITVE